MGGKMRERINLFLWGIILFAAVQGIGILAGLKFKDYLECYQINFLRIYWWQFLILFGAVSLVIFNIPKITKILHRISRKMLKKKLNFLETKFNRFKEKIKIQSLWQIGFSILIGFVGFAATAMFFYYPYAIVFGIILAAAWVLISRVWYHNFSMMLLLVTFGIIFGFGLSCWSSLIILGSLAIYDLLAVYRFKFMVEFSKNMVKSGSILGFIIPRLKISDFNARLKEVSSNFKVNLSENKPERFSLTGEETQDCH